MEILLGGMKNEFFGFGFSSRVLVHDLFFYSSIAIGKERRCVHWARNCFSGCSISVFRFLSKLILETNSVTPSFAETTKMVL